MTGHEQTSPPSEKQPLAALGTPTRARKQARIKGGYACQHAGCDRVFDIPSRLTRHERAHLPPRQYCHICQAFFKFPQRLGRHYRDEHGVSMPGRPVGGESEESQGKEGADLLESAEEE